ncbi:hypothetical protein LXL04_030207 [Taraxacum kok-saghyz]
MNRVMTHGPIRCAGNKSLLGELVLLQWAEKFRMTQNSPFSKVLKVSLVSSVALVRVYSTLMKEESYETYDDNEFHVIETPMLGFKSDEYELRKRSKKNDERISSGVPVRCAGDSFIRRMVSFRETELPKAIIESTQDQTAAIFRKCPQVPQQMGLTFKWLFTEEDLTGKYFESLAYFVDWDQICKDIHKFLHFFGCKIGPNLDIIKRFKSKWLLLEDEPAAFCLLVAFGCSAPDSIGSLTGLDGYALIQDVCRKVFVDSLLEVGLEVFDIYAPA